MVHPEVIRVLAAIAAASFTWVRTVVFMISKDGGGGEGISDQR